MAGLSYSLKFFVDGLQNFILGIGGGEFRGNIAQGLQAPFSDDALGFFGDDAEHAADPGLIVRQRAVRERVIRFFGKAAALQEQE